MVTTVKDNDNIDFQSRMKKGCEPNRDFDTTQLHYKHFQYQPHKDYLGHVYRWGFASRYVKRGMSVLDVGCGQDLPFLRSLGGSSANTIPDLYVGVDLNTIKDIPKRKWATVLDKFNFIEDYEELELDYGEFDLIVNFEVFEHIELSLSRGLLKGMRALLAKGGRLVFSTPVYCESFKMARNHINELRKDEVEAELHNAGFKIVKQFGTFGNVNDFKKVASPELLEQYNACREFYGDDILGSMLSPMFPEASRNITHVCMRDDEDVEECELKESVLA